MSAFDGPRNTRTRRQGRSTTQVDGGRNTIRSSRTSLDAQLAKLATVRPDYTGAGFVEGTLGQTRLGVPPPDRFEIPSRNGANGIDMARELSFLGV